MVLPPNLTIDLEPGDTGRLLRFGLAVLSRWRNARFDAEKCGKELEAVRAEHQLPEEWFRMEGFKDGGLVTTDALLFDQFRETKGWRFNARRGSAALSLPLTADQVPAMARLIQGGAQLNTVEDYTELCLQLGFKEIPPILRRESDSASPDIERWRPVDRPGIYRREHASIIFNTGQTRLMTDPQNFCRGWTTHGARYPVETNLETVDAVAITHGHDDHWNLASMLRFSDPERTQVLVPKVPRPNLLATFDMRAAVALTGLRSSALQWGESLQLGDLKVTALPFYGEQPLVDPPGIHPDLRNWGNCYRLEGPSFSAILLADSGSDPSGDGAEAVAESVRREGPVDLLLSCSFEFPEALNFGVADYWMCVPFERLQKIYREDRRRSMTFGAKGVARACIAAGAKYFLPYAQGFSGIGRSPRSAEAEDAEEATACKEIREQLLALGGRTQVVEWNPGDLATFEEGGELRIHPAHEA